MKVLFQTIHLLAASSLVLGGGYNRDIHSHTVHEGVKEALKYQVHEEQMQKFVQQYAEIFDLPLDSPEYTIFAPVDLAFDDFFGDTKDQVKDLLTILAYHISATKVDPATFEGTAQVVETSLKTDGIEESNQVVIVKVLPEGNVVVSFGLGEANVVNTAVVTITTPERVIDITIHFIDAVLQPPGTTADTAVAGGLSELVNALTAADLVQTVNDAVSITVFAPSNDAFAAGVPDAELVDILTYHVVPQVIYSPNLVPGVVTVPTLQGGSLEVVVGDDGSVQVNGFNVILADVLMDNGVVHVIDGVLDPTGAPPAPVENGREGNGNEEDDVAAVTQSAEGSASTLLPSLVSLLATIGILV